MEAVKITRPSAQEAEAALSALVSLLQDGVASGASLGFLPPVGDADAHSYWAGVIEEVVNENRIVLVARQSRQGDQIAGSVQLALATKPNARHRAEVQKLIVLRSARRQGIGHLLMEAIESEARMERRSLLVLDTCQGDDAERLYRRLGYREAGVIPSYARGASGRLEASVFFYRLLDEHSALIG